MSFSVIDPAVANPNDFEFTSVSVLIMTHDGKILLQKRDAAAPAYPHHLATFGGSLNDKSEPPKDAAARELYEELGAAVKTDDLVFLNTIVGKREHMTALIYNYFWHDKDKTITGCFEGMPATFNTVEEIYDHGRLMGNLDLLLYEAKARKFIK